MSERIPAEIWIGGGVPAALVSELCGAITAEGVTLDWGDGIFEPADAQDLRNAASQNPQGLSLLRLCDARAVWGEFPHLEKFLQTHHLSYSRHSEGRDNYDPETSEFRPFLGDPVTYTTYADGEPSVQAADLKPVAELLAAAIELTEQSVPHSATERWSLVRTAHRLLCEQLPAVVPPLPPFRVLEEGVLSDEEGHTQAGD